MINSNNILAALTKAANTVATDMKSKTSGGNYPKELPGSIVVESAKVIGEGKYSVSIVVKHPAGAAYEFGSGIHATRGTAKKYEIAPRNAPVLAFPWQPEFVPWGSRKFAGVVLEGKDTTKGQYFFHVVEHPGVEARPYARPSLQAKKAEIAKQLGTAFKASISILGGKYTEVIK